MANKVLKAFAKKVKGKLIAIASGEKEDRQGEIVKADGWILGPYKQNPVIQPAHNYTAPPIGYAKSIKVVGKQLIFEPVFHTITQIAREYKEMYQSEPPIMRAFSVGFIPLEREEKNPRVITRQELLEISAVSVPASREALLTGKSYSDEDQKKVKSWIIKRTKGVRIKDEDVFEIGEKPYPNFHACRLKNPDTFQPDSFRVMKRRHNGKQYNVIMGRLKGETTLTEQSYRYPKDVWAVSEAKKHCKDHKGIMFEPATGKEVKCEECDRKKKEVKEKKVIPYSIHGDGAKAPEDESWNAGKELKKASGNATRLMKMHAWVDNLADGFDASERKWYKLPHHKGDGAQAVVWRGVSAGMAALFGARGGVKLPTGDRKGVYNHLAKHYKQFDKEAPEFKDYSVEELWKMDEQGIIDAGDIVSVSKVLFREMQKRVREIRIERWNKSLSEVFDVETAEGPPASFEYDLFTKFLDCKVKDIFQNNYLVPSPLLGSYLAGFKSILSEFDLVDTRNFAYSGSELPPVYEVIRLNSKESDDFLIDGVRFYRVKGRNKLIVKYTPTWFGINISLVSKTVDRNWNKEILERAHKWVEENNYLRGERFALSGEFIEKTKDSWEGLILKKGTKDIIMKSISFAKRKGKKMVSRGMLFVGEVGTGKTKTGRIIMNDVDSTFIWISSRDFDVVHPLKALRIAFSLARKLAPSVLFIEDIDTWLDSYAIDLLKTEMDGLRQNKGVFTVLTSNYPERLPDALLDRPGRFHDVISFDLPNRGIRKAMLVKWIKKIDGKVLDEVVEKTKGFSGAHMRELVDFAKVIAEEDGISMGEALLRSLEKLIKQRELISSIRDKVKSLIQLKEGRVLSGKNRETIRKTVSALQTAISVLEELLKATEPPEKSSAETEGQKPEVERSKPKESQPRASGKEEPIVNEEVLRRTLEKVVNPVDRKVGYLIRKIIKKGK